MKCKKIAMLFLIALFAGGYLITPAAAQQISGSFITAPSAELQVVSISPDTATINCIPDAQYWFSVTVRVRDMHGNADINLVTLVSQAPDGSALNTYFHTPGDGSFVIIDENTIDVSYNVPFECFYAPATNYHVVASVEEQTNHDTAQLTSGNIEFTAAVGLSADGPNLDFGVLSDGSVSAEKTSQLRNIANTEIFVRATAPDWSSDAGGSPVPANTLTANGIAMNAGDPMTSMTPGPGGNPQQIVYVETVPPQASGFTLAGTYTTTITLTAAVT